MAFLLKHSKLGISSRHNLNDITVEVILVKSSDLLCHVFGWSGKN